jgi:hypothetical protein
MHNEGRGGMDQGFDTRRTVVGQDIENCDL